MIDIVAPRREKDRRDNEEPKAPKSRIETVEAKRAKLRRDIEEPT